MGPALTAALTYSSSSNRVSSPSLIPAPCWANQPPRTIDLWMPASDADVAHPAALIAGEGWRSCAAGQRLSLEAPKESPDSTDPTKRNSYGLICSVSTHRAYSQQIAAQPKRFRGQFQMKKLLFVVFTVVILAACSIESSEAISPAMEARQKTLTAEGASATMMPARRAAVNGSTSFRETQRGVPENRTA
jgi:hypothetical protein